jgi:hypothetical protein
MDEGGPDHVLVVLEVDLARPGVAISRPDLAVVHHTGGDPEDSGHRDRDQLGVPARHEGKSSAALSPAVTERRAPLPSMKRAGPEGRQ